MKNNITKLLIGIALMFTAGAAYSEPVEYTFSNTSGHGNSDPRLTGLTSVLGSFVYDNAAASVGTVSGGTNFDGSTIYVFPESNLSGNVNGNRFSHSLGGFVVGDNKFTVFDPPTDIFTIGWGFPPDVPVSGFSIEGLTLERVGIFWIAGQLGIGDFLSDQSLPTVLPPTMSGLLELDFFDADGVVQSAVFFVALAPVLAADINFTGQLAVVDTDLGGAVYSGVPVGTEFFGEFDLGAGLSTISDGTIVTPFTAFFENGSFFEFTNNFVLDASVAALLNSLPGTGFTEGDSIDLIEIYGDAPNSVGGRIEIGLHYVLVPSAFDVESPDNYPPHPDDVLKTFFSIDERDDADALFYDALGAVDSDGDGIQDLIDGTFNGVFNDQSAIVSDAFTDQHRAGATFGSIVARSDNLITVADVSTLGVVLTAVGGTGTTQVQTCNIQPNGRPAVISLTAGDKIIVTCGSFTGETLAGSVTVSIGMNVDVSIPAGAIAFIEELPGAVLSISNLGGTGAPDIEINDNGNITNLGSDEPPLMTILTVVVNGCDSGVANDVLPGGASIAELVTVAFNSGGEDAVEDLVEDLEDDGFLSEREAEAIEECAEDDDDDSDSDSD